MSTRADDAITTASGRPFNEDEWRTSVNNYLLMNGFQSLPRPGPTIQSQPESPSGMTGEEVALMRGVSAAKSPVARRAAQKALDDYYVRRDTIQKNRESQVAAGRAERAKPHLGIGPITVEDVPKPYDYNAERHSSGTIEHMYGGEAPTQPVPQPAPSAPRGFGQGNVEPNFEPSPVAQHMRVQQIIARRRLGADYPVTPDVQAARRMLPGGAEAQREDQRNVATLLATQPIADATARHAVTAHPAALPPHLVQQRDMSVGDALQLYGQMQAANPTGKLNKDE